MTSITGVKCTYTSLQSRRQYCCWFCPCALTWLSVENAARSDSFHVQNNVCFAKILAALSYFSQCKSRISKYSEALENNHTYSHSYSYNITRAPGDVVKRYTCYCERPRCYPDYRGKRDLRLQTSAAEDNEICRRHTEVVGCVEKRRRHNPRECTLQTCECSLSKVRTSRRRK